MNTLSGLSKTKILQSLPQHFIDDNIEDIIKKLEEINNKWSIYQWVSYDSFSLVADNITTKDLIKEFVEFYDRCYLYNKEYLRFNIILLSFKQQKFIPQDATIDNIQDVEYLTKNITIDPSINYTLNMDETSFVYISCSQKFLKETLEQVVKHHVP